MEIYKSKNFQKNVETCKERNYQMDKLKVVISTLANGMVLDRKYQDHKLHGKQSDYRECHIEPDWLLVYRIANGVLYLASTGTHSDLY